MLWFSEKVGFVGGNQAQHTGELFHGRITRDPLIIFREDPQPEIAQSLRQPGGQQRLLLIPKRDAAFVVDQRAETEKFI